MPTMLTNKSESEWIHRFKRLEDQCILPISRYSTHGNDAWKKDSRIWDLYFDALKTLRKEVMDCYACQSKRPLLLDSLRTSGVILPEIAKRIGERFRALHLLPNAVGLPDELLNIILFAQRLEDDLTFILTPECCKPIYAIHDVLSGAPIEEVPHDLIFDALSQVEHAAELDPYLITLCDMSSIAANYHQSPKKCLQSTIASEIGRTLAIQTLLNISGTQKTDRHVSSSWLIGGVIKVVYKCCKHLFKDIEEQSVDVMVFAIQTIFQILHQARLCLYKHQDGYCDDQAIYDEILSKAIVFLD
ncbi:hypothetical protein ABKN59_007779 [Abortiporus biennis]